MFRSGYYSGNHAVPGLTAVHPRCADILKFFGCELGAQTKFDKDTGNSIVNGALTGTQCCANCSASRSSNRHN